MFLKQFIESEIPWAHIDIAGMAETPKELPYSPKGATGFGVRLILQYLRQLK
jgi:leucyl aminopeptidase